MSHPINLKLEVYRKLGEMEENQKQDKTQIGLSSEGNSHIKHLQQEYELFDDEQDAYRFAIAYAVAKKFTENDLPEITERKNKFGTGSIDKDGKIRDLIRIYMPEHSSRPYAMAEILAEIGLFHLHSALDEGKTLTDLLKDC
jgi:hypothetical protein